MFKLCLRKEGVFLLHLNSKTTISTKMSAANHLEQIRSQSQYPTYRTVTGVAVVLGYIAGVIMGIIGALGLVNGLSDSRDDAVYLGIVLLIAAAVVIFVIVPFYKEVSLMAVDLVDSTLETNSRS